MLSYESQVTINRSAAVVFPYLTEPDRQKLWSGVPMRPLDNRSQLGPGSRFEVTFGMGPLKAKIGLEVTSFDSDRRLSFRSFSGPIHWEGEYRLADSGSGSTIVSQEGRLAFTGYWRIVQPLVGREISRGEVKELERLREVVERA